jgi:Na+/H+ antiporter NhaC
MIDSLVPWSPAGVFVNSHLGVPTILYAPFVFVCQHQYLMYFGDIVVTLYLKHQRKK